MLETASKKAVFMFNDKQSEQNRALYSISLGDAIADFYLSRKAMLCSPATLEFYGFTAGKFIKWLQNNQVKQPDEITSRHIRAYLVELSNRGLKDNTIHGHARAIRTFLRFSHAENYSDNNLKFAMPSISKIRLPVLSEDELKRFLATCEKTRDFALVMFLVDTGARRAELLSLNWGDINLENGVVRIAHGKGNKYRSVVVGLKTRRALLKYRRTVNHMKKSPLFQTYSGTGLKASGLRSMLLRIGKRSGLNVSPHVLRRTFATMSLRAGMNIIHLQGLMGHSSLEMTRKYIQLLESDLVEAHRMHGPIDNL